VRDLKGSLAGVRSQGKKGRNMHADPPQIEQLLTPKEVSDMFGVGRATVTRWAKTGMLTSIRTLGGHRRYRADEVRGLMSGTHKPQKQL
jgi:excisionase family DNA binding protein